LDYFWRFSGKKTSQYSVGHSINIHGGDPLLCIHLSAKSADSAPGITMVPESKIFLGGVEDGGAVEGRESRRVCM
jgi:hypothetical protein